MKSYIADGSISDATVEGLLADVKIKDGVDANLVYFTLVALYIFREVFDEKQDEW